MRRALNFVQLSRYRSLIEGINSRMCQRGITELCIAITLGENAYYQLRISSHRNNVTQDANIDGHGKCNISLFTWDKKYMPFIHRNYNLGLQMTSTDNGTNMRDLTFIRTIFSIFDNSKGKCT